MTLLHFFNPTCELVLERGAKSYTPPASLVPFERDLDLLPLIYASKESLVALRKPLSDVERHYFKWLNGGTLPVVALNELYVNTEELLITPWGFAPNIEHQLKQLSGGKLFISSWNTAWRDFLSRKTAVEFLNHSSFLDQLDFKPPFMPTLVGSMEEIFKLVGSGEFVVKSLWSSSGRGVFISKEAKLTRNELNMVASYFRQGHQVVVEPYFDKVEDFSMQFMVDSSQRVTFKAVTLFETDSRGRYVGSLVGADIEAFCLKYEDAFCGLTIDGFAAKIGNELEKILNNYPYNPLINNKLERPVGVDMMIYRNAACEMRLHPCIEINWRYTMGFVAHCLTERLDKGLHGRMVVGQIANWQEKAIKAYESTDFSLKPFSNPGFYPLSRWMGDVQFGAFLEVEV